METQDVTYSRDPLAVYSRDPLAVYSRDPLAVYRHGPVAVYCHDPLAVYGHDPSAVYGRDPLAVCGLKKARTRLSFSCLMEAIAWPLAQRSDLVQTSSYWPLRCCANKQ